MATQKLTRTRSAQPVPLPVQSAAGQHSDFDRMGFVAENLGKAWGLTQLVSSQVSGELLKPAGFASLAATMSRVFEVIHEISELMLPQRVGEVIRPLLAVCEVLRAEFFAFEGKEQHFGSEVLDWALWALRDDLKLARDVVDEAWEGRA